MDWLLVRCWYEYCGAVNGRNDLDACWLIAHDARIPLSPAGNVKKRIACALDPKIIPDNIACRGRGSIGSAVLGAVTKLRHRRMLATLEGKQLRTSSWASL